MNASQSDINAAKTKCFRDCSSGLHLDFEAGCCSICKSPEDCQGWVPYLEHKTTLREHKK
jgi:hypothetical protein